MKALAPSLHVVAPPPLPGNQTSETTAPLYPAMMDNSKCQLISIYLPISHQHTLWQ